MGVVMAVKSTHLVSVKHRISAGERARSNKHRGGVLWFTGLPGSGKSTLAVETEHKLFNNGRQAYVLDGDNVRQGLSSDLGFSHDDRTENIRRIGEVAALFADAGFIVITAFISPYLKDREIARQAAGAIFHEIYIDSDIETCERRDPKGHYKLARAGKIPEFTGVSAPYEAPESPEFSVDTQNLSVEECVDELVQYIDLKLVG
ncbi:MAG: adenylyl-sulfate kinase [Rhodospirillaceae bacterium]|jgi:bifunctional enzyme CysN/CysC|nr:adenylyl-sulfate kinase [Rhodospirillaceae bacterium]|tara:strand:- start:845 stop:1456 length:612 start_codon:yes stop_codon:yes gene_type:complete